MYKDIQYVRFVGGSGDGRVELLGSTCTIGPQDKFEVTLNGEEYFWYGEVEFDNMAVVYYEPETDKATVGLDRGQSHSDSEPNQEHYV